MDTGAVLLVGSRKRDGGDNGTSFPVRFRPNVDSPCAETIMKGFKGGSVRKRTAVGESGRFLEVGGCRGHFR